MAVEGTRFQVNFKTAAGTLINVYAESVVDGIATMNEMSAAADLIRQIETALSGGNYTAVPQNVVQLPPQPTFVPQAAPAPTAQADEGRICAHGPMTYRTGNGAKGPWRAYFCPTPKGTPGQCDPQFIR